MSTNPSEKRVVPTVDYSVRPFAASADLNEYVAGSKPKIAEESDLLFTGLWNHAAYKIKHLELTTDGANTLTSLTAVIEVFFIEDQTKKSGYSPQDQGLEQKMRDLGTVHYWGTLVPGTGTDSNAKWDVRTSASCNYSEKSFKHLPDLLQKIGPGAFITAVTQSLFGTQIGLKMLKLDSYHIPGSDIGLKKN